MPGKWTAKQRQQYKRTIAARKKMGRKVSKAKPVAELAGAKIVTQINDPDLMPQDVRGIVGIYREKMADLETRRLAIGECQERLGYLLESMERLGVSPQCRAEFEMEAMRTILRNI